MTKAKSGALSALAKLKSERAALDAREADLTDQAARELGHVMLSAGLDQFSPAGLKSAMNAMRTLGEIETLARLQATK
jgi:hypothetical protein